MELVGSLVLLAYKRSCILGVQFLIIGLLLICKLLRVLNFWRCQILRWIWGLGKDLLLLVKLGLWLRFLEASSIVKRRQYRRLSTFSILAQLSDLAGELCDGHIGLFQLVVHVLLVLD